MLHGIHKNKTIPIELMFTTEKAEMSRLTGAFISVEVMMMITYAEPFDTFSMLLTTWQACVGCVNN